MIRTNLLENKGSGLRKSLTNSVRLFIRVVRFAYVYVRIFPIFQSGCVGYITGYTKNQQVI